MTLLTCRCGALKKYIHQINDIIRDTPCPLCHTKLEDRSSISKQSKLRSWMEQNEDNNATRRNMILSELKKKEATDRELTKRLGYEDPNKVRPRRKELVDMGFIKEVAKRPCEVTKKTVTVWGEA